MNDVEKHSRRLLQQTKDSNNDTYQLTLKNEDLNYSQGFSSYRTVNTLRIGHNQ
jgi:hypothetical protein